MWTLREVVVVVVVACQTLVSLELVVLEELDIR